MPAGRLDDFAPPPPAGRRAEVHAELAAHLVAVRPGARVVVALDGVDGAGKTVLGRELAALVEVPFEVSVPRGSARFGPVGATESDPASDVNARYVGGQRLYLAEVDPACCATWVLDNTDLAAPVLRGAGTAAGSPGQGSGHASPGAP